MKPLKCLIAFGTAVLVAALVLVLPESGQASERDSFYPIYLTNNRGKQIKLRWTYIINERRPLTVNESGVELTFHLSRLQVIVNPKMSRRSAVLTARISGRASGTATMQAIERLKVTEDGKITVTRQSLNVVANLLADGQSATVAVDLLARLIPPREIVLDRDDLDRYEIGHEFGNPVPIMVKVKGSVCAEAAGQRRCSPINQKGVSPEYWKIIDFVPTLTVGGRTYTDVVAVKSVAVVPGVNNVSGGGNASTDATETTYWLARGIGMIKGVGQYNFFGQPLEVELQATNIR